MRYDPKTYTERTQYDFIFGENLDELRKNRGLTMRQLAEQSGVSVSSVRGYINGRNEPTSYAIFRMAKTIGCSCESLVNPPGMYPEEERR